MYSNPQAPCNTEIINQSTFGNHCHKKLLLENYFQDILTNKTSVKTIEKLASRSSHYSK